MVRSASDDAQPHDAPTAGAYGRGPRRVGNVNTTDMRSAIELGTRAMARCFNADDDDRPFLYSRLWPDGWFGFSPWHGAVQIGGRHLEAMLRAAAVTGTPPDDDAIEKHTRASFFSFGGPIPLPCNRRELGGQLVEIDEHGIREGFLALNALVRDRNNDQAAELAESFIAAIQEFWSPERGWDVASLKRRSGLPFYARPTFVEGLGRAIGPLVKYFRTTGSDAALELAQTLKDHTLDKFFLADGSYETERFGAHGHSTTCVMSSLAQLADLTDDAALLERVRTFYDRGLWTIRDEIGWVMERSDAGRNPDQGELNNTGDVVETALILARRGYPSYYDDAEQILRAHLLPSQFRDTSFVGPAPEPDDSDARRDVADRALGMFGFCAPVCAPADRDTRSRSQLGHRRRHDGFALRGVRGRGASRRRRHASESVVRPGNAGCARGVQLCRRDAAGHAAAGWRNRGAHPGMAQHGRHPCRARGAQAALCGRVSGIPEPDAEPGHHASRKAAHSRVGAETSHPGHSRAAAGRGG